MTTEKSFAFSAIDDINSLAHLGRMILKKIPENKILGLKQLHSLFTVVDFLESNFTNRDLKKPSVLKMFVVNKRVLEASFVLEFSSPANRKTYTVQIKTPPEHFKPINHMKKAWGITSYLMNPPIVIPDTSYSFTEITTDPDCLARFIDVSKARYSKNAFKVFNCLLRCERNILGMTQKAMQNSSKVNELIYMAGLGVLWGYLNHTYKMNSIAFPTMTESDKIFARRLLWAYALNKIDGSMFITYPDETAQGRIIRRMFGLVDTPTTVASPRHITVSHFTLSGMEEHAAYTTGTAGTS